MYYEFSHATITLWKTEERVLLERKALDFKCLQIDNLTPLNWKKT